MLEETFIRKKDDMVTLRDGREWSVLHEFFEDLIRKLDCRLIYVSLYAINAVNEADETPREYFALIISKRRPVMHLSSTSRLLESRSWLEQ
jgi:hypothetical protein